MNFPQMFPLQRLFDSPPALEAKAATARALARLDLERRIRPGDSVAITVGSRGITDIGRIIRQLGASLTDAGARPFVVPAMGSHGGATPEGQQKIVEGFGINAARTGTPIRSSMEVVRIGRTPDGHPVWQDKQAWEADHIMVVGRVKPHTDFNAAVESGLYKMMVIGLGNQTGAAMAHDLFASAGFEATLSTIGQVILDTGKILAGLAIVENQRHEIVALEAVKPEHFLKKEAQLLQSARQWMADLPFDRIDLLMVDAIGKNISGTGMDTNVVGRKHFIHGVQAPGAPLVRRIYVRDLTPETRGNATGVGLADYTHDRLIKKIDYAATFDNCITGNNPRSGAVPIHYATDARVLQEALKTIGRPDPLQARLVWIRNTLELETAAVSEAFMSEALERDDIQILGPPRALTFDTAGDLLPL